MWVRCGGPADDLPGVVDPSRHAVAAAQGAQILHHSVRPEEGMLLRKVIRCQHASDLIRGVDAARHALIVTGERAQTADPRPIVEETDSECTALSAGFDPAGDVTPGVDHLRTAPPRGGWCEIVQRAVVHEGMGWCTEGCTKPGATDDLSCVVDAPGPVDRDAEDTVQVLHSCPVEQEAMLGPSGDAGNPDCLTQAIHPAHQGPAAP